jgi:hypothetical protein
MITNMDFELKSKRVIFKRSIIQANLEFIKSETVIYFQNLINDKLNRHDPPIFLQSSFKQNIFLSDNFFKQTSDPELLTPVDNPAGFFSLKI